MMNQYSKQKQGYTLVELLVVIAIIGIFSSFSFAAYSKARDQALDAKRMADLHEFRNALEIYYSVNRTYRVDNSGWRGGGQGFLTHEDSANYPRSVARALYEGGYMAALITADPEGISNNYMIYLCDRGNNYSLSATLSEPAMTEEEITESGYCNTDPDTGNAVHTRYGKNYVIGLENN